MYSLMIFFKRYFYFNSSRIQREKLPRNQSKTDKVRVVFSVELSLFGVVWSKIGNTGLNRWFHSVTGIADESDMKTNGSII